jgi:uncharacterized protein YigA (DUF484 family)
VKEILQEHNEELSRSLSHLKKAAEENEDTLADVRTALTQRVEVFGNRLMLLAAVSAVEGIGLIYLLVKVLS